MAPTLIASRTHNSSGTSAGGVAPATGLSQVLIITSRFHRRRSSPMSSDLRPSLAPTLTSRSCSEVWPIRPLATHSTHAGSRSVQFFTPAEGRQNFCVTGVAIGALSPVATAGSLTASLGSRRPRPPRVYLLYAQVVTSWRLGPSFGESPVAEIAVGQAPDLRRHQSWPEREGGDKVAAAVAHRSDSAGSCCVARA
jgi:hypothetical protein